MIQATDSVRVYRHPGADRASAFPLEEGRARYLRPLVTDGSQDSPDVFDVRERLPLEFAGDSPQQAGKRAKRIEQDLLDTFDVFDAVDAPTDDETDSTSTSDSTSESEADA